MDLFARHPKLKDRVIDGLLFALVGASLAGLVYAFTNAVPGFLLSSP
jgi:hypothetical protein